MFPCISIIDTLSIIFVLKYYNVINENVVFLSVSLHSLKCIIIYLQSDCIEKHQFRLCSKYDREHDFDVILCRKHPKATILAVRRNFHVALEVTLHHDWKTSRWCNRCIISLTTCEVLRHATSSFLHSSGIIKYLFHENLCPITF